MLESRSHAVARGADPYARISAVSTDRAQRTEPGQIRQVLQQLFKWASVNLAPSPIAILSGASGVEPATREEWDFLDDLGANGFTTTIRAFGSRLGHAVEAQFPLGLSIAALALNRGELFAPSDDVEDAMTSSLERVLVTGVGHWRGEGLALLERVTGGRTQ